MTPIFQMDHRDFSHQQIPIPQRITDEQGQSTIEFVMCFAFVVLIIGIFVRMAVNISNGYIVHYATFQASRAYLVNDNNSNTVGSTDNAARSKAIQVFKEILPNFPTNKVIVRPPGNTETAKSVFTGVVASFSQPFALSVMGGDQEVTMVSESFLGREPPIYYCYTRTCDAIKLLSGVDNCRGNTTVADNGC